MVNDVVALHLAQSSPTTFQAQPPHFGNVVEENILPLTKTVLWDNAVLSVMQATAGVPADFNLDVISDADPANITKFIGKVVLRIAPGGPTMAGSTVLDPAGGTSREFAGAVVAVYKRTPSEAPGTGSDYVLIQIHDTETFYEDLATRFTVLKNR